MGELPPSPIAAPVDTVKSHRRESVQPSRGSQLLWATDRVHVSVCRCVVAQRKHFALCVLRITSNNRNARHTACNTVGHTPYARLSSLLHIHSLYNRFDSPPKNREGADCEDASGSPASPEWKCVPSMILLHNIQFSTVVRSDSNNNTHTADRLVLGTAVLIAHFLPACLQGCF